MAEEPTAVVIAGSDASGRSAVLGNLLGHPGAVAPAPPSGYVVVTYNRTGTVVSPARNPCGYPHRPPRRVDVGLAHPLLRRFALVDAPAADRLGLAGTRILTDVAGRGGAAVYTLRCGARIAPTEYTVLTELVQAGVAVFFALTPDAAGRWRGPARRGGRIEVPDCDDPAGAAVDMYRRLVDARVPALRDASWFTVDPPAADVAFLRQALVGWASGEALRRAADNPVPGRLTIPLPADAVGSRWSVRLDRAHRHAGYAVRHYIGVELAGLHLRWVQQLMRGADSDGMLWLLDDELRALSLSADAAFDHQLGQMFDEVLRAIFGEAAPAGARCRLAAAVRSRIAADQMAAALLVTSTGALATVPGSKAVTALRAYPAAADTRVLPSTAMALAGDLWSPRRTTDAGELRALVDRSVEQLELAMAAEVDRRFHAVRQALHRVVDDAMQAGVLPC